MPTPLLRFNAYNGGMAYDTRHHPANRPLDTDVSTLLRVMRQARDEGYSPVTYASGTFWPDTSDPTLPATGTPVPLLNMVQARQQLLQELQPMNMLRLTFLTPDWDEIAATTVYFEGSVDEGEGWVEVQYHNKQVFQDAWVSLLSVQEPDFSIEDLARFGGVKIQLAANLVNVPGLSARQMERRRAWMQEIDNEQAERFQRMTWASEFIRTIFAGDIDRDEDEPEDLQVPVIAANSNERTFGLEFEFLSNGYSQEHFGAAVELALRNVRDDTRLIVRGYGHSDGTCWDLKTDSSCGYELCSPAITWRNWSSVEAVLKALHTAGARVNDRCGFHVHHFATDLRATGLRRLLLLWMAYEKVLMASVRANRKGNRYCQTFEETVGTWEQFKNSLSPINNMRAVINDLGRYRALNATGWWSHGRIEVRLHHGTLHPQAIRFWTLLTQQMVEFAKSTRSYSAMEEAFRAEFKAQVERFGSAVTYRTQHPEIMQLPKVLESAILRRNADTLKIEGVTL